MRFVSTNRRNSPKF